jgi:hypothetical protein
VVAVEQVFMLPLLRSDVLSVRFADS